MDNAAARAPRRSFPAGHVAPAVGVGVGGVHQAMLDPEMLMQNLSCRGKAVGGAAAVADDRMLLRIVQLVVNPITMVKSSFLPGAEMITRFAPPL